MIKKILIVTSVAFSTQLFGTESIKTIKVDTNSDYEIDTATNIMDKYNANYRLLKDQSNNILIEIDASAETINSLINQLRIGLGDSTKIEQVSNDKIKNGSQDGDFGK